MAKIKDETGLEVVAWVVMVLSGLMSFGWASLAMNYLPNGAAFVVGAFSFIPNCWILLWLVNNLPDPEASETVYLLFSDHDTALAVAGSVAVADQMLAEHIAAAETADEQEYRKNNAHFVPIQMRC